ncbi:hypothetical protein [Rickettsiales endosymbiont of Peranema trichophorum]|uniref:hypothetical protein n=1 Tax=Rickettsiales endosymbiont of Peranema trichophorum TaxID=2486577 RepID=UPI001A927379|nr:hypothetical protein [Rickettsiales endosymbiont of Peranema trichophorum]
MALPFEGLMSGEIVKHVKKEHVTYPNVWRHSVPGYIVDVYFSPDRKVIVQFKACSCKGCCEGSIEGWRGREEHYVLEFFTGMTTKIGDERKFGEFVKKKNLKLYRADNNQIRLQSGLNIRTYCAEQSKECMYNGLLRCLLVKGRVKPGEVLKKGARNTKSFSIVRVYDQVTRERYEEGDEKICGKGGTFLYKKLAFFGRNLVALDDNTFLAYDKSGDLIVRFNENLKTKFRAGNPSWINGMILEGEFFVLPYARIKALASKVKEEGEYTVQGLHDRVLLDIRNKCGRGQRLTKDGWVPDPFPKGCK